MGSRLRLIDLVNTIHSATQMSVILVCSYYNTIKHFYPSFSSCIIKLRNGMKLEKESFSFSSNYRVELT